MVFAINGFKRSQSALLASALALFALTQADMRHAAFAAGPTSVAEIAQYAGADRAQILDAGARKEKALMIYTTGTQIQPLIDRFKQIYPYLDVQMPRATSEDVARKVIEEYGAGYYEADVFELSSYGLIVPRQMGILQPFQSPEAKAYPDSAIEKDRMWISVRESYVGIGYNTNLISAADAPKTYQDLLDPKWKGKMAISYSMSTTANVIGAMVLTLGEDYVRKLGAQDNRVYPLLGRALANLTISGEAPISWTTYDSHVQASRAQGAPIAWIAPGPVPVTDTSVALASKAQHPHASMLFIDFLLSAEGQALYQKLGYSSARNGMQPADKPAVTKLYLTNRPTYVNDYEAWTKLTQESFIKPK
jgi:iron(III) transport system substrate-binding protein